jgi:hypothetical protein
MTRRGYFINVLMIMYCSGDCDEPKAKTNAEMYEGSSDVGSIRIYGCLAGYSPFGSASVTCLDDSTWSTSDFGCIGVYLIIYGVTGSRGHGVTGSRGHGVTGSGAWTTLLGVPRTLGV